MGVANKVRESGLILGGLGVLGFIGIVWLMIYGNLQGNLGFQDDSITIANETTGWLNQTGYTLAGVTDVGANSFTITQVLNGSSGLVILSGNYTLTSDGVLRNATATTWPSVYVAYTYLRDSTGEKDADAVITNQTGGFLTFFGFSNTFFTIGAIVLLIFMLVGLLAIVMSIAKGRSEKNSKGFAGY